MNEPWFDVNTMAWLPGTALGCLGGLWGSLLGMCGRPATWSKAGSTARFCTGIAAKHSVSFA